MLCKVHRQKYPTLKGKPLESENGFYVIEYCCLSSKTDDPAAVDASGNDLLGQLFTATGYKIPREQLVQYDFKGHWEVNKQFRNFVIEDFTEIHSKDEKSVVSFLETRLKGIGKKRAQQLWDEFGADVFDVIEKTPEKLGALKGISKVMVEQMVHSYNETRCVKNIHLMLSPLGISPKTADQIYGVYGVNSEKMIKEKPYEFVRRFKGISFAAADKIAMMNKLEPESKERVLAAALEVLYQNEHGGDLNRMESGHLCIEARELIDKTCMLLNQSRRLDYQYVFDSIQQYCREGNVICQQDQIMSNGQRIAYIYTKKMFDLEMDLAYNMTRLVRTGFRNTFSIPEEIRLKELKEHIALAPEQKAAVEKGLSNAFAVITGGPGTGKTTILKFIRDIYKDRNKDCKILLCSPTGVAATRMTASTGAEACTVHKALNLRPDDENGGVFGTVPQLDYDFIVVDETSMLDIYLSSALLQAIKYRARLLFIGDIDQLPSVGSGAVLRDIIESGVVPVARLTKVYRQAAENKIAINAILIKNGKSSFDYKQGEFEFIPAESFAHARNIMEELYMKEVAANGIDNVMMLSPYRKKTESGVDSLNLMRDKINPPGQGKAEVLVGDKLFRVGDKVINLKNNDVASNGETGMIISIGTKIFVNDRQEEEIKKCITVDFGHSQRDYDMEGAQEMLDWAYAMTVHKSQGSEAKVVILNLMDGHFNMLKRNLLYTAITRAKVRVYIVGQMTAIERSVKSGISFEERRKTMLAARLKWMASLSDAQFSALTNFLNEDNKKKRKKKTA